MRNPEMRPDIIDKAKRHGVAYRGRQETEVAADVLRSQVYDLRATGAASTGAGSMVNPFTQGSAKAIAWQVIVEMISRRGRQGWATLDEIKRAVLVRAVADEVKLPERFDKWLSRFVETERRNLPFETEKVTVLRRKFGGKY